MEFIKKKIKQKTIIKTIDNDSLENVIVPDLNAVYYFKISLVQNISDIGFFDIIPLSNSYDEIIVNNNYYNYLEGLTQYNSLNIINKISDIDIAEYSESNITITGLSSSRLSELRKYVITNVFANQYVTGGNTETDGVDLISSNPNSSIIYFIGGIRYVDTIVNNVTVKTTFSFIGQGYNGPDFITAPIYKNQNKENIVDNPKIYDDVFIIRQELSAFDKNYRLEYVKNLVDLETYASGGFFNVVNNT